MATVYSLDVTNKSKNFGNICVYQTNPEGNPANANVFSLAWFSKACHPETTVVFEWTIDYSFVWSETGKLVQGVKFRASEVANCDPSDTANNSILFSKPFGAYRFEAPKYQARPGSLDIYTSELVPHAEASVGIGMAGKAALVCEATPNYTYTFTPHPTYWVAFGTFQPGEVIDLNKVTSHSKQVVFEPNVYSVALILNGKNEWEKVQSLRESNRLALEAVA